MTVKCCICKEEKFELSFKVVNMDGDEMVLCRDCLLEIDPRFKKEVK